jgi:N-acetylmuramoyl-L-alanine amidase
MRKRWSFTIGGNASPFRFGYQTLMKLACSAAVSFFISSSLFAATKPRMEAVRFWSFDDVTRIAIETHGEYRLTYDHLSSPPRLLFDLHGSHPLGARQKGIRVFRVGDRLIRQIRVAETEPGISRVVVDLEVPAEFNSSQLINPNRLMIEVRAKHHASPDALIVRSKVGVRRTTDASMKTSSLSETSRTSSALPAAVMPPLPTTPLFSELALPAKPSAPREVLPKSTLVWNDAGSTSKPVRVASAIVPSASAATVVPTPAPPVQISPAKTDEANRSLVRVFGLKIHKVVIDAGHGGHDTGTIGPKGLTEKDLVLDVALRLGRLVQQRLGAEVVYTRHDDTFIPLEQRTKIANGEKADLFISIHANSSPAPVATGVETYYFNFTTDQHSIDLATRENASSNSSIFQLNDLLHKAVLNAKVEESRDFAQKVQTSLYSMSAKMNNASRDRGVKKAPFVVLIGASMPSILAEVGFISNPHDEKLLRRDDQRQKIAESLFKGVSGYASSLSHVQLARINGSNSN